MSNPTPHLNLSRPAQTDFYNVDVFNENAGRIDAAIARIDESFVPPNNAFTGTSAQTAITAARTVNVMTPFTRTIGSIVWVKFASRITAVNPTLNINSTGAARIRVRNGNDSSIADFITPNRYYCFLYTEESAVGAWQLLNPDGTTIPRAFSLTEAAVAAKSANTAGFNSLVRGAVVWVTFATHNTATTALTLNINSTGAVSMNFVNNTRQLLMGRWYAFAFNGSSYQLILADPPGEKDGFAEVATAAATVAKIATIPKFDRQRGATVWLRFPTGNTAGSPTLNISSTGAAAIQFNGSALSAGAIIAGGVYGFVFDGTTWQILNPTLASNLSNSTGVLPISNGGTGLTASPSMLTNLGTTAAANVLAASPRPGVTGTLPIANGGTGATTVAAARNTLGLGNTAGALPVANGGTGLTASPSMLTNLGTTAAANVLVASPRPGITGTLSIANGGTGATTQVTARTNLGITEGVWTPQITHRDSDPHEAFGRWSRVGNMVTLSFLVNILFPASTTTTVRISGLPFAGLRYPVTIAPGSTATVAGGAGLVTTQGAGGAPSQLDHVTFGVRVGPAPSFTTELSVNWPTNRAGTSGIIVGTVSYPLS